MATPAKLDAVRRVLQTLTWPIFAVAPGRLSSKRTELVKSFPMACCAMVPITTPTRVLRWNLSGRSVALDTSAGTYVR